MFECFLETLLHTDPRLRSSLSEDEFEMIVRLLILLYLSHLREDEDGEALLFDLQDPYDLKEKMVF
jgi:hypothetical protein